MSVCDACRGIADRRMSLLAGYGAPFVANKDRC